jgi:hypothetical protein
MLKFIIKTFDQLKKDNFDQVNFGQTTPCPLMQPIKLKLKLKRIQTKKLKKTSIERVYHYVEDEKRFSRICKQLIFGKKK